MTPTVTLRATFDCTWWSPDAGDEIPVQWGGFCDPHNPWGTAQDDEPANPRCVKCDHPIFWRHEYNGGIKVRGATGWLHRDYAWHDEPEPDEWCEHVPDWPVQEGSDDPAIELTLPIREAAEFIIEFPGGVWDTEQECDPYQDPRTGVHTRVTLHVSGDGAQAALGLARRLTLFATIRRLRATETPEQTTERRRLRRENRQIMRERLTTR